jgi:flavodoxin
VSYTKSKKTESVATIINDNIVKETFDTEEKNYPTAVSVPIWNIFPDPYK